jgi:hypothetical protein
MPFSNFLANRSIIFNLIRRAIIATSAIDHLGVNIENQNEVEQQYSDESQRTQLQIALMDAMREVANEVDADILFMIIPRYNKETLDVVTPKNWTQKAEKLVNNVKLLFMVMILKFSGCQVSQS